MKTISISGEYFEPLCSTTLDDYATHARIHLVLLTAGGFAISESWTACGIRKYQITKRLDVIDVRQALEVWDSIK